MGRDAGTPDQVTAAWATASHLSLGEVVLVALAVALVAVLLHADPRTTMRYDRARASLDRHATCIVSACLAGAAR